jgi:hypothetical protein
VAVPAALLVPEKPPSVTCTPFFGVEVTVNVNVTIGSCVMFWLATVLGDVEVTTI